MNAHEQDDYDIWWIDEGKYLACKKGLESEGQEVSGFHFIIIKQWRGRGGWPASSHAPQRPLARLMEDTPGRYLAT